MTNEYMDAASKIFTEDFLIFMDTIPKNKTRAKRVLKIAKELNNVLSGKPLGDCMLALSFYFPSIIIDNEIDIDGALEDIHKFKGDIKAEEYIQ